MKPLFAILRRPAGRGALIGAACGLASWLAATLPVGRGLEEWCQDACIVHRGPRASRANVVLVALDDASLRDLPRPLPFLSTELATVVADLGRRGASAVGLDLMVSEDLDDFPGVRDGAIAFGLAAGQAGNVVLPALSRGDGTLHKPLTLWQAGTTLGLVGLDDDPADHFLRRQWLARDGRYGFAAALVNVAGAIGDDRPDGRLRIAGRVVPLEEGGRVRINYVGPAGTIRRVSFREVLASAGGPLSDQRGRPVDFRGAIAILGVTAAGLNDLHAVPFSNGTLWGLGTGRSALMPGAEVHANLVATLADGAFITTPWWLSSLPQVLAVGGLLGAALARMSLARGAALTVAHHFAWKAACLAAFCYGHWRVEMVAMLLTGATCYAATFASRWHWLRRTFGAVKRETIARALEDDPDQLRLKGEERVITVLFSDVRGFTTFSEDHTPAEAVALLNAYFGAVVPIVESHGGTVDKYIGDGLMVLFGAPRPQPDHATRAVRASRAMVAKVHELADRWAALGFPGMRIGVGVHTGPAVVGTIGSPDRLDYTAIGDTVNAASRSESANKTLGSEVLISAATRRAVPEAELARLGCAPRPESVTVKGKAEPLELYRVEVAGGPIAGEPGRRVGNADEVP